MASDVFSDSMPQVVDRSRVWIRDGPVKRVLDIWPKWRSYCSYRNVEGPEFKVSEMEVDTWRLVVNERVVQKQRLVLGPHTRNHVPTGLEVNEL